MLETNDTEAQLSGSTRRRLLAGAALAGGAGVVATLGRAEPAFAAELDGYFNVLDPQYGAVNDGTHPELTTPGIQAALTDAGTTPGGTVYLPPGTYAINAALNLPANVRLVGHGSKSVIKAVSSVATVLKNTGTADILVEDLKIDVNHLSTAYAVSITNAQRVYLRNLEIVNNDPQNGNAAGPSIWISNLRVGAVEGCTIHAGSKEGISVQGSSSGQVTIEGNLIEDCGYDHISVLGSASQIAVVGNVCNATTTKSGACIAVASPEVDVTGNLCVGGARGGIELRAGASDCVVADNVILEPGNVTGAKSWPAGPVNFGGALGSGISILSSSAGPDVRANVRGNIIFAPRNHGIHIGPGSGTIKDLSVCDNVIWRGAPPIQNQTQLTTGCGIACISPTGTIQEVRLSGNDVRDAGGGGIRVINDAGATCKRWDVLDNRMINSGSGSLPAIELTSVSSASVVGNRADTQSYGLKCTSPADELIVADNTFTGNLGSNQPILFAGSMANLHKLRVRDNPGYSPWAGQLTTSGTWQSLTPPGLSGVTWYYKAFSLSSGFPVQFGATPNVVVTTNAEGYSASVTSVSATTFSGRVWIPSVIKPSDTFNVTVYWVAEAID